MMRLMTRLGSSAYRERLSILIWLTCLVASDPLAHSQEVTNTKEGLIERTQAAPQATVASDGESAAARTVPLGVTPAGVQRHISGQWATLAVNGVNTQDQDAEETVLFSFKGDDTDQVARRVWIPAKSRRQAWFPILIPETAPDQLQITGQTIQLATTNNGESFKSNRVGSPTSQRSLLLSPPEDEQAAMVLDSVTSVDASGFDAQSISQMIYAGFDTATNVRQDLGIVRLANHFLPTTANPLDSLDDLIIASDAMIHDTVGVAKLRQWLHDGGRVWLMADRVSPDSARRLLGDAVHYSVLESVQLNNFTIEKLDPYFATVNLEEKWESETPVDFYRVMLGSGEVHSRIDGWPAAFWVPVGNGEILVTTLGHEGWMLNGEPTETYRDLASRFFAERNATIDHSDLMVRELDREIGYQIPSRSVVSLLLGSHLLFLGFTGLYLKKRKTLHQLGWILPSSVVGTVLILLVVGATSTSAVPSTIAFGQLARVSVDTSQLLIDSSVAVYSQSAEELPIEFDNNTVTTLDSDWDNTEVHRREFADQGLGRWRFLKQPPGKIQHVHVKTRQNLKTPWELRGSFDENGFIGELVGLDYSEASDAVVVSGASPSMSVVFDHGENQMIGGAEQVLLPDQYYDGSLLTDSQRKRQEFIRQLLRENPGFLPKSPSMLIWTRPITHGFEISNDFVRRGWALALFPIQVEAPEPDTSFLVPSSFITIDSYTSERGMSSLYNSATGQWLDSIDKPAAVDLKVQVPAVIAPCEISRCDFEIQANAQGRRIQFYGFADGKEQLLHEIENAQGLSTFTVENPKVFELDPKAGFRLTVKVTESMQEKILKGDDASLELGQPAGASTNQVANETFDTKPLKDASVTWGIKYLNLSVHGRTGS